MTTELQIELESLDRQEAFYNDYWLGLNNNTEEEMEWNKKIKARLDERRNELNKLINEAGN
jgi:hypothetical protein